MTMQGDGGAGAKGGKRSEEAQTLTWTQTIPKRYLVPTDSRFGSQAQKMPAVGSQFPVCRRSSCLDTLGDHGAQTSPSQHDRQVTRPVAFALKVRCDLGLNRLLGLEGAWSDDVEFPARFPKRPHGNDMVVDEDASYKWAWREMLVRVNRHLIGWTKSNGDMEPLNVDAPASDAKHIRDCKCDQDGFSFRCFKSWQDWKPGSCSKR